MLLGKHPMCQGAADLLQVIFLKVDLSTKSQLSLDEAKSEKIHYHYIFSSWQVCIHIILPFYKQILSEWKIKMNTSPAACDSKTTLKMLNLKATFSLYCINFQASILITSDYYLDPESALLCHIFPFCWSSHASQCHYLERKAFLQPDSSISDLWCFARK